MQYAKFSILHTLVLTLSLNMICAHNAITLAGLSHSGQILIHDIIKQVFKKSSSTVPPITFLDIEKTNTYTIHESDALIILLRDPKTRLLTMINHEVMHNYKAHNKTIKTLVNELVLDYGSTMKTYFDPAFDAEHTQTIADTYRGYAALQPPALHTIRYESITVDLIAALRKLGITNIDNKTLKTIIVETQHKHGIRLNSTMSGIDNWRRFVAKETQEHFNTIMKPVLTDFKY